MLGDGHVKPYINISKIIPKLEFHASGKNSGPKKTIISNDYQKIL
jgi:hypothetical protein